MMFIHRLLAILLLCLLPWAVFAQQLSTTLAVPKTSRFIICETEASIVKRLPALMPGSYLRAIKEVAKSCGNKSLPRLSGFLFPVSLLFNRANLQQKLFQRVIIDDKEQTNCSAPVAATHHNVVEYFHLRLARQPGFSTFGRDIHFGAHCCSNTNSDLVPLGTTFSRKVTAEVAGFPSPPVGFLNTFGPIPFGENAKILGPSVYKKRFTDSKLGTTTLEIKIQNQATLKWNYVYDHDLCNTPPRTSCNQRFCLQGDYQTRASATSSWSAPIPFSYQRP